MFTDVTVLTVYKNDLADDDAAGIMLNAVYDILFL